MTKRGYHHGNLRQALVEAALGLIAEMGPQGFTLSEAAKAADVTPAAVYRHFAGRDDLLAEVARQGYEIFADLMAFAYAGGKPSDLAAIEATGRVEKLEALLALLEPYGVKELVQSGLVAIGRGPRSITDRAIRH